MKWQHFLFTAADIRSILITTSEQSFFIPGVREKRRLSRENLNKKNEANPVTAVDKAYYNVISGTAILLLITSEKLLVWFVKPYQEFIPQLQYCT